MRHTLADLATECLRWALLFCVAVTSFGCRHAADTANNTSTASDATPMNNSTDEPLYRISESGLWGFIDRSGKVVIAPQFHAANDFSEGLANVVLGEGYKKQSGFIDATGKFVIRPGPPPGFKVPDGRRYQYKDFHEGRAVFWVGDSTGRGGYIDRNGRLVIKVEYNDVGDFSEGLAYVSLPGDVQPSFESKASGFINQQGDFVFPPDRSFFAIGFSGGVCPITRWEDNGENQCSVIDRQGTTVVRPGIYDSISEFTDGLARVVKDGKVGFIDRDGRVVIPIEFDRLGEFGRSNTATAQKDGKCLVIDREGHTMAKLDLPLEAWTGPFSEGLAFVKLDKIGFMNERGDVVIPMKFEKVESFRGGLALVKQGSTEGYIDKSGQFVWKTEQWEKPVPYALTEPLSKFLPPGTIASLPLDYEWESYTNAIVFVADDRLDELEEWFTAQFGDEFDVSTSEDEPGRLDLFMHGKANVFVYLADTSNEEMFEGFIEWLASKNLKDLRRKHQPKVVGIALLSSKD